MNDREEVMRLYNENIKIVDRTIERNFNSPNFRICHGISREEMYQSGLIGLYKACCEYDPSKNIKFQTYAINVVKWTIMTETKRDSLGRKGKWTTDLLNRTSFDKDINGDRFPDIQTLHDTVGECENLFDEVEERMLTENVLNRIDTKISEQMGMIVRYKLMQLTNKQIAELLNLSHQRVSYLLRTHKEFITRYINA